MREFRVADALNPTYRSVRVSERVLAASTGVRAARSRQQEHNRTPQISLTGRRVQGKGITPLPPPPRIRTGRGKVLSTYVR